MDIIEGSDSGRPRDIRPGKVFSRTCVSTTGSREERTPPMANETSCAGDIGLENKSET